MKFEDAEDLERSARILAERIAMRFTEAQGDGYRQSRTISSDEYKSCEADMHTLSELRSEHANHRTGMAAGESNVIDGLVAESLATMIEMQPDDLVRLNDLRHLQIENPECLAVIQALARALSACNPCPAWMLVVHLPEAEAEEQFRDNLEEAVFSELRTLYDESGRDIRVRLSLARYLARRAEAFCGQPKSVPTLIRIVDLWEEFNPSNLRGERYYEVGEHESQIRFSLESLLERGLALSDGDTRREIARLLSHVESWPSGFGK